MQNISEASEPQRKQSQAVRTESSAEGQRRCKECQIVKPLEMFSKNKPSYLGRFTICRVCRKKKLYKNNPWEKHRQRAWSRCMVKDAPYKKRGLKFNITQEDVKKAWFDCKAYDMKRPSIDRINGQIGYEPSNIRFVELKDNLRKLFGRWSIHFDKCIRCGTTILKHHSKGLCFKCYRTEWVMKEKLRGSTP